MTIHIQKLPTFALYAAYTDESGLTVFGSCRDEAVNNLTDALARRLPETAGEGRGATSG